MRLGHAGVFLSVTALLPVALRAQSPGDLANRRTAVVRAYEQAQDSVVNISTTRVTEPLRPFGGLLGEFFARPRVTASVGSGFVIHQAGYVVTNAHVAARATSLRITFADGTSRDGSVVAADTDHDLAVLRVHARRPLKPLKLGRSDDLMIGEPTIAIGNPVGLHNTVTTGVVSALGRDVELGPNLVYRDLIQTDASINPGSSGGPLLNANGELIGINTAIRADAQNIGFAIPVNRLRELLPDILDIEKLDRVELGMQVYGLDAPRVVRVRRDSPAADAGIRTGDEVVRVAGQEIRRDVDFYFAMLDRKPGERVPVVLRRAGKRKSVTLRLAEVPPPDAVALADRHLGIGLAPLKPIVARKLGIRPDSGVMVERIEAHGPADRAGLQPGDLLIQIGQFRVRSLEQVGQILTLVESDDEVYVQMWRFLRGEAHLLETRIYTR